MPILARAVLHTHPQESPHYLEVLKEEPCGMTAMNPVLNKTFFLGHGCQTTEIALFCRVADFLEIQKSFLASIGNATVTCW